MTIELGTPAPDELDEAVGALRDWQHEGAPMQLHPGDVGWAWRFGAETTAATVRTWRHNGRIVAAGMLDHPRLLRVTLAPEYRRDEELAHQLAADVTDPARGVLPAGEAYVEAPKDALLRDLLAGRGWYPGEPWTPLRHDLAEQAPAPGVRVEPVGPDRVPERTAVQRASSERSTSTGQRWPAMAAGSPYAEARCLLAYDADGTAVATVTVWSAGPGKPGLLEPMGVHRDHRGHGYGRAISAAAAAALRELGSSSALVCTPTANPGAVATYASAGFRPWPEISDLCRGA